MAYSDFTATQLIQKFGLSFKAETLFPALQPIIPSDWLVTALQKGQQLGFSTEKSRSERLVTPILLELSEMNDYQISVYSGINLDMDEKQGLKGECDFVFSFSRIQDFVTAPIFYITEAKKQDLEQGTIQCAAQLAGARRFNEMANEKIAILFGCCTTGIEWRFLCYQDDVMILGEERFYLTELDRLLGALQAVIEWARG